MRWRTSALPGASSGIFWDAAEGIEVVHNVDQLKARAAKKRADKAHRRELKSRRAQRMAFSPPQAEEQISIFGVLQTKVKPQNEKI